MVGVLFFHPHSQPLPLPLPPSLACMGTQSELRVTDSRLHANEVCLKFIVKAPPPRGPFPSLSNTNLPPTFVPQIWRPLESLLAGSPLSPSPTAFSLSLLPTTFLKWGVCEGAFFSQPSQTPLAQASLSPKEGFWGLKCQSLLTVALPHSLVKSCPPLPSLLSPNSQPCLDPVSPFQSSCPSPTPPIMIISLSLDYICFTSSEIKIL